MRRLPAVPSAADDLEFDLDVSVFERRPARRVPVRALWALPAMLALGYWTGGSFAESSERASAGEVRAAPLGASSPEALAISSPGGEVAPPLAARADLTVPGASRSPITSPVEEVRPPAATKVKPTRATTAAAATRTARGSAAGAPAPSRPAVHDRLAALAPKAGPVGSAALKSAGAQQAWDGNWAQALALYTQAARAAPADPDAWFGIGLCQAELEQPRFATRTVRYVLALAPDHALAHVLAGFLAQDRGRLAEAREHYERALALQPDGLFAEELASVLEQLPRPPPEPRTRTAPGSTRVALARTGGAR